MICDRESKVLVLDFKILDDLVLDVLVFDDLRIFSFGTLVLDYLDLDF